MINQPQRFRLRQQRSQLTGLAVGAAVVLSLLAGCTTPGADAASTSTIPGRVLEGTDGVAAGSETGFAVNADKAEVVLVMGAVSATLTPAGDADWDLTLQGVSDTMTRTSKSDSGTVTTASFFADPSTLTARLGTANSVLSGNLAGDGPTNLVMSVGSPTFTADGDAGFEASGLQTGKLGARLARSGGVSVTPEQRTSADVALLPVDPTEPMVLNDVELHLSVTAGQVVDGCVLLPATNCTGADLFQLNLVNGDLSGADFREANLAMSTLHETNFTGVDLTSAQVFRSDLTNTTFVDATLDGAAFEQSTLLNANLSGVSAKRVNLFRSEMSGVQLTDANLSDANLAQVIAQGARMSAVTATHADFTGADLRNSDLSGADLSFANLAGANLTGVNFTGANLTGAVLWLADINGASFTGAVFSRTTCPDGSVTQDTNRGTAKKPQIVQVCTPIYLPGVAAGQPAGPRPAGPGN